MTTITVSTAVIESPPASPWTCAPTQIASSGAPVKRFTAAQRHQRQEQQPLGVRRRHRGEVSRTQSGFAYSCTSCGRASRRARRARARPCASRRAPPRAQVRGARHVTPNACASSAWRQPAAAVLARDRELVDPALALAEATTPTSTTSSPRGRLRTRDTSRRPLGPAQPDAQPRRGAASRSATVQTRARPRSAARCRPAPARTRAASGSDSGACGSRARSRAAAPPSARSRRPEHAIARVPVAERGRQPAPTRADLASAPPRRGCATRQSGAVRTFGRADASRRARRATPGRARRSTGARSQRRARRPRSTASCCSRRPERRRVGLTDAALIPRPRSRSATCRRATRPAPCRRCRRRRRAAAAPSRARVRRSATCAQLGRHRRAAALAAARATAASVLPISSVFVSRDRVARRRAGTRRPSSRSAPARAAASPPGGRR